MEQVPLSEPTQTLSSVLCYVMFVTHLTGPSNIRIYNMIHPTTGIHLNYMNGIY